MNHAPIVLFVYNRPEHTRRVLEALSKNLGAQESELYIFADGPKENASEEDLQKIKDVKNVVLEKKWCGKIYTVFSEHNKGLANSVISGVTEVINLKGKVIVLEDDIVTVKYFLKFMNDALSTYEKEPKVFGITGYKYPTSKIVKPVTYFLPIGCSWSYATWLDRWDRVIFDGQILLEMVNNRNLKEKMNFGNYPFYEMLESQAKGNVDSWAIRFYASMFLNNNLFLFPNRSLVSNIGFDSTGTNCKEDMFFSEVSALEAQLVVEKNNPRVSQEIVRLFTSEFNAQFPVKTATITAKLTKAIERLRNYTNQ